MQINVCQLQPPFPFSIVWGLFQLPLIILNSVDPISTISDFLRVFKLYHQSIFQFGQTMDNNSPCTKAKKWQFMATTKFCT